MTCRKIPHDMSTKQTLLTFQPVLMSQTEGASYVGLIGAWKFDQDVMRNFVAKMIILDELPIHFFEGEGFRNLMSAMPPF